jgi:hypothetical protein
MFSSKFTPKSQGTSMFTSAGILERDEPETLEEGIHELVITDVTDLGIVHSNFGDKRKLKISLGSTVPSVKSPGKNITLFMTCTASLSDQSNFGGFVKALGFNNNVAKFSVVQLCGTKFKGNVINTVSDKTKLVYSNLDQVVPGTVQIPAGNIPVEAI